MFRSRDLSELEVGSTKGPDAKTAPLTSREVLAAANISPELRSYAGKHILSHGDVRPEELMERLEFLSENIPVEMLSESYAGRDFGKKFKLQDFLRIRMPFLKALRRRLSESEWLEILNDQEKCKSFCAAAFSGRMILGANEKTFEGFAKRKELPISAEEGEEKKAVEVKDMLGASGIEQIAIPFVREVKMVKPVETHYRHGNYDHLTGEVTAAVSGRGLFLLPDTILHETGHGVHYRMVRDKRGAELFDQYVVAAQLDETPFSEYAKSFEYSHGRASIAYIKEAFADDFRTYWMIPESLSESKRAVFDGACDRFLPGVDRDKVRKQIAAVLGNYYGKSVKEAVGRNIANPDKTAKRMVKSRNRQYDEAEKERRIRQQNADNY